MAETHLVSGLKNLRAEKLGILQEIKQQIESLEAHAARVEAVIAHIDGVMQDVAPEVDLAAVKPTRSRRDQKEKRLTDGSSHRLPMTQHVLRVLREEGPKTASEIVARLSNLRPGHDPDKLKKSTSVFLSQKVKAGLLMLDGIQDGLQVYAIKR
jgi:hypothetical protein